MSALELAAAALALVNVVLVVRRSVWNYPFGLAAVLVYAVVFYRARLYSDALLQLVFVALQAYGWWAWARGATPDGTVAVRTLSAPGRWAFLGLAIALSGALGAAMSRWTDAAAAYPDAAVAGFSIVVQWLLAKRCLESWLFWIGVDLVAVGLFLERGLYPTAVLYAVFLALASAGALAWSRASRGRDPAAAGA